jgi:hypothetical protein
MEDYNKRSHRFILEKKISPDPFIILDISVILLITSNRKCCNKFKKEKVTLRKYIITFNHVENYTKEIISYKLLCCLTTALLYVIK